MKKIFPYGRWCLAITLLVLSAAILAPQASAETVTTPILIATSSNEAPTLAIPRWKGYVSELDPQNIWVSFGSGGSSSSSMTYSTNAGTSWSSTTLRIDNTGSLDMHLSAFGRAESLYFTFPGSFGQGICFRKYNTPAHAESDRESLQVLSGTTSSHRSNVMVDNNGRIWVFTRRGGSSSENVRYQYSDNGSSWTTGVAYATGASDVRIGSMPYINGNAALVVFHVSDNRGYEYYLWNGSSFEARPDHSIYAQNMGSVRVFTHNVVNGTTMHLIFGYGNDLHHVWKDYNSGTGSWTHQTIESSAYTDDVEWYPVSTSRGDDLYVFYCRKSSSSASDSRIYYKRWSQTSETWTDPVHVSTVGGSTSRDPNTCFQVPVSADYVPVFWRSGSSIYFAKIMVDSVEIDSIAPGRTIDLGASSGSEPGEIDLNWTAPGDDAYTGTADHYEIRHATDVLNDGNWASGTIATPAPTPLVAGSAQVFTASALAGGEIRYFALKTFDEVGNSSEVSNAAFALVSDVDDGPADPLLPRTASIGNNYPNPFNQMTSIHYSVAGSSLVDVAVYDILGQRVRTLVHQPRKSGEYRVQWNGDNDRGAVVGSGVYLCRLEAGDDIDTHKMVLLK